MAQRGTRFGSVCCFRNIQAVSETLAHLVPRDQDGQHVTTVGGARLASSWPRICRATPGLSDEEPRRARARLALARRAVPSFTFYRRERHCRQLGAVVFFYFRGLLFFFSLGAIAKV